MPDHFSIRLASVDDAPSLAELLEQLEFPTPLDQVRIRLQALLTAGETVLVGEYQRKVAGLVSIHITPVLHRPTSVGRITVIVVRENLRGLQLGRKLVEAAEEHVRQNGCALIELTSNFKLTQAHGFYEHLGYTKTSYRFIKQLR